MMIILEGAPGLAGMSRVNYPCCMRAIAVFDTSLSISNIIIRSRKKQDKKF